MEIVFSIQLHFPVVNWKPAACFCSSTLAAVGVRANDLIMVLPQAAPAAPHQPAASAAPTAAANPATTNPDGSAVHPEQMMQLLQSGDLGRLPPELADAVRRRDVESFQTQLRRLTAERRAAATEEARFLRLAEEDPFNPEVQVWVGGWGM